MGGANDPDSARVDIHEGVTVAQTFTISDRNFSRLDVFFPAARPFIPDTTRERRQWLLGRAEDHPVIVRLFDGRKKRVGRWALPVAELNRPHMKTFRFAKLPPGRYEVRIQAPGLPAAAAAAVALAGDLYGGGEAKVDGRPAGGDLRFDPYVTLDSRQFFGTLFMRLVRDKPFAVSYFLILAGVTGLTVWSWRLKPRGQA